MVVSTSPLTRTSDQPRQRRKRKCAVCRNQFEPRSNSHKACKPECSEVFAQQQRKQAERKQDRARKVALKTRSDWIKEAQHAFNAYIRARDRNQPCICCGKPLKDNDTGGGFDCGHYRSVGSAPHLRFDERNANGQTKQCNRYGSGRAVDYRIGLIARIGLAAVEALEADQTPRRYTIPELQQIKATFKAKLAELRQATILRG
jgi:hypothetical protein